uniref:DUF2188 domain-containing protein n=1 Tax=Heterorhabditis bacteriophora TaxID=37862 RepID=A0A1I7W7G5_HETBA
MSTGKAFLNDRESDRPLIDANPSWIRCRDGSWHSARLPEGRAAARASASGQRSMVIPSHALSASKTTHTCCP